MASPKQNPNRWYFVMVFCVVFSLLVFTVAPHLGYDRGAARDIAIMIALWAPTLGVLGLRAESLKKGAE